MKLTDWYYKAAAEAQKLGTSRSVVFPCKLEVRKANMAERRTDLPPVSSSRSEISKLTVRPFVRPCTQLLCCHVPTFWGTTAPAPRKFAVADLANQIISPNPATYQ
jgi:hypothetical protein